MTVTRRLWAGGDSELWYSDDGGDSWVEVSGLPGRIEGLWGPRTSPKVYTVVDGIGLHAWEEGVGWTQELANANARCGFSWAAALSHIWCAADDSVAFTNGIGPVPGVWSRQGSPGTPWTPSVFGTSNKVDVHGTPDGSAVFALEVPAFVGWTLYQHTGGGTFVPVESIPAGTIYQLRVISATEVYLFGVTANTVEVYWWFGGPPILLYSYDLTFLPVGSPPASFVSWAGVWLSDDGNDGGMTVVANDGIQDYNVYFRRTGGGAWSLDDGDIQASRVATRCAGIQDAADDRLLFSQGRFQRRSGGLWVDGGWEPIGAWTDGLPDGYDLRWQEIDVPDPPVVDDEPDCVLPHRVYPMVIRSIRDADRDEGKLLLKRWTEGIDAAWGITWCRIRDLPDLIDPEECPAEALEYLGWIVGLTKAMEGLTGGISESDLRQLIAIAVRTWKRKGSGLGFAETLRSISGYDVRYLTWFHFRALLDEFELGPAETDVDPWLLDQPGGLPAVAPDGIEVERVVRGDVLPSAVDPTWTYVPEGAVEGATFSAISGTLRQLVIGSDLGGRYERDDPGIVAGDAELATRFRVATAVDVPGTPWFLEIEDGDRGYRLVWSNGVIALHDSAGTLVAGPRSRGLETGREYEIRLRRDGGTVEASIDGRSVFGAIAASDFAASANTRYGFGYRRDGTARPNTWIAVWTDVGPKPILTFDLSTLLGVTEAVPHDVRVIYRGRSGIVAPSYWSGTRNEVSVHDSLGEPLPLDLDLSNFTVGVDPDEFVSDLRVVDDGTLDRGFVSRLVAVLRPAGERVFVRFVDFQDVFRNRDLRYWEEISGTTATRPDDGRIDLEDAGSETVIHADMPAASTWDEFVATAQFALRDAVAGKWGELRFRVVDAANFYAVRVDPGTRVIDLDRVVAGVRTTLASHGPLDVFHPDVLYLVHVTLEDVVGGTLIKFYLDWRYLGEATDSAHAAGTLGLAVAAGQRLSASLVDLVRCPFTAVRVGPGPELEPNWAHACTI